jgi:hypothetical protein
LTFKLLFYFTKKQEVMAMRPFHPLNSLVVN